VPAKKRRSPREKKQLSYSREKFPDTPLGVRLAFSLRQRVVRGMSAASTEQPRIEKVLRRTDLRKAPVDDREFAAKLRG